MATLERAIALAIEAHKGQVDKAGVPYILHPLRVMLSVETVEERIVAVLHDVVEDTYITLETLRKEGFSEAVVRAIKSLTKCRGEEYQNFIRRAAADPIGRKVKLADLMDNCNLTRISNPTSKDLKRVSKYCRAIEYIRSLSCEKS